MKIIPQRNNNIRIYIFFNESHRRFGGDFPRVFCFHHVVRFHRQDHTAGEGTWNFSVALTLALRHLNPNSWSIGSGHSQGRSVWLLRSHLRGLLEVL